MNAVTEVMDELRKALAELEDCRARNADMRTMLEQVTRERDEARASCTDCAMWAERSARWHDDMQRAERERDEERENVTRLSRLLKMAEDEAVAADDHGRREARRADAAEADAERLGAERDEARAEVEKLSESAKAAWEAECVMREQRDRYHAEWKQERQEVERLHLDVGCLQLGLTVTSEAYRAGFMAGSRAAFRRGAEAMREACACVVEDADDGVPLQCLADDLRDLPIPEEP